MQTVSETDRQTLFVNVFVFGHKKYKVVPVFN